MDLVDKEVGIANMISAQRKSQMQRAGSANGSGRISGGAEEEDLIGELALEAELSHAVQLLAERQDAELAEKVYAADGPASVFSSITSLTNTILGAGMLGMSRAIQSSGLCLGVAIIALVSIVNGYSIVLLNSASAKLPVGVTPSYYKLAEAAFPKEKNGHNWGAKLTAFVMAMTTFSGTTCFIIIVADAVSPLVSHFAGIALEDVNRTLIQAASMVVVLPLALLENLDSFAFASMLSIAALFFTSSLVVHAGYLKAVGPGGYRGCDDQDLVAASASDAVDLITEIGKNLTERVLGGASAVAVDAAVAEVCVELPLYKAEWSAIDTVSVATLAYTCQMNVFTVKRELSNPTSARWSTVWICSNIVALLVYLTVGSAGYIAFGESVAGNVVKDLEQSDPLVIAGRAMLAFSFIVSIPMMAHPCVKNMMLAGVKGSRRTVVLIVLGTALAVATAITDVGLMFRWFGGPNSAIMAYIFPPMFYFRLAPAANMKHRAAATLVFGCGAFYLAVKVFIPIFSAFFMLLEGVKADSGITPPNHAAYAPPAVPTHSDSLRYRRMGP